MVRSTRWWCVVMAAAVATVAVVGTAFAALTWSSPVTIDPAAQLSWNDGGPVDRVHRRGGAGALRQ